MGAAVQITPANTFSHCRAVSSPELDELSLQDTPITARLRAAYFRAYRFFNKKPFAKYGAQHIPQWDGGKDRHGRKHRPIWPRIARMLITYDIDDPERFVLAQFDAHVDKRIYPTMLLTQDAIEIYHKYAETADDILLSELQRENDLFIQLTSACSNDTPESRWRAVLSDLSNDISPLLRYVIAVSSNLEDVAAKLRSAAVMQFMLDPCGYLRVWGRIKQIRMILEDLSDRSIAYDSDGEAPDSQCSGADAGVHNTQQGCAQRSRSMS